MDGRVRSLRFYGQDIRNERVALDMVQSRHLSRVLRLHIGDTVEVFDGNGLLAEAVIERMDRDHTVVRITRQIQVAPKTHGRILLAVSIAKGDRFDWMIEKCTELGADHIAAVRYDRTVKMGTSAMLERCQKIALAAAKQCGRLHLPLLTGPSDLAGTLAALRPLYPDARLLYGDPDGQPLAPAAETPPDTLVCIGPEGGFSDAERHLFAQAAARPACVNPHILRIETAAIAFAAVLQARAV